MCEGAEFGFLDTVKIMPAPETTSCGLAGRTGTVLGESVPSLSGVEPVIGDLGAGHAFAVSFDGDGAAQWFAPHLLEFVDHGGEQVLALDGGPTFHRDADGSWREVAPPTREGEFLCPGGAIPYQVASRPGVLAGLLRTVRRRSGR
jgi:hypothetical protein